MGYARSPSFTVIVCIALRDTWNGNRSGPGGVGRRTGPTLFYGPHKASSKPVARVIVRLPTLRCATMTILSGRSAVRLAHLLWEQGVGGSNPLAPTIFKNCRRRDLTVTHATCFLYPLRHNREVNGENHCLTSVRTKRTGRASNLLLVVCIRLRIRLR